MTKYAPASRCALVAALSMLCLEAADAQTTWIYGECDGQLGSPQAGVANYATDCYVPSDPILPGKKSGMISPPIPPALSRASSDGGVAVDKINKLLYVTNGDKNGAGAGNLTLYISPLPGDSCVQGAAASTMTVTGTYPFLYNVTGIAIENWISPVTGLDEPYRMWCSSGFDTAGGGATFGQYDYFWLTPSPPPGGAQGAWSGAGARGIPNGGFNTRDIAFGLVQVVSPTGVNTRHSCLFGIAGGLMPWTMVDVWDVNSNTLLYTDNSAGFTDASGIAIDTSMPIDLVSASPPPAFGPKRRMSGRVLVFGTRVGVPLPYIRDISANPSPLVQSTWTPSGIGNCNNNPYYTGMSYSAELVTASQPSGLGCVTGLVSSARADVNLQYLPNMNPAPINPAHRQDPALPGQPLATLNYGTAPSFDVIACNFPPGEAPAGTTPFLLVQKNGSTPWTDPATGQTLIATPPGSGVLTPPTGVVLPATWNGGPLISEASVFTSALLNVPLSPVPPANYNLPASPRHHVYYAQWIFVCGQHAIWPSNFPVPFSTAEAVRVALSNVD